MSRFKLAAALLPLFVAFASAAPAPAPVNPVKAVALPVPAKALVVVQVNGIDTARGHLEKMLQSALPDLAEKTSKQFDEAISQAAGGRDLKAVTPGARLFVVIPDFEFGPDGPPMIVMIPVKDYATFREKLLTVDERKSFRKGNDGIDEIETDDHTAYLLDLTAKSGYVAISQKKESVESLTGKYETLTAAGMGAAVSEAFLGADVSVYVNMDRVNDVYGDKIRQFRQLFQVLLQQAAGMGAAGLDKKQLEMISEMYDGLFQAAEDARGFVLGVEFRDVGVNLRIQSAFATGTDTSKALAQESPLPTQELNAAPAGFATYVAGRIGPKLSAAMVKMAQEYGPGEDNERAKAAVEKFLELSIASTGDGFLQAANAPDLSLEIANTKDAKALVDAQLKVLKTLEAGGIFVNVPLKEKPVVTTDAQKIEGFTLHEAKLVLDFEAAVKHIADENLRDTTLASMKRMAKEKTTMWFGTDGKRVIQINAVNWAAAEKVLKEYLAGKNRISDNPAFKTARAQLPTESGVVMLADMGKMTLMMGDLASDIGGSIPGLPIGKLPKPKATNDPPSYLGASVSLKPTEFRFDLFVPSAGIKSTRNILKPLFEQADD